jgi:tRNA nucleotidyltransferase (CCA-adding enzyme)
MGSMQADTVIATHGNTDFDAFAAMLAARRLYPEAVGCLAGSLNRNVREFYRLHADELGLVEAARLELGAIRRLIVVETVHASRLGELEPVALDPQVEKIVFDHHAGEPPGWASPEHTILSEDGALTTTLVGILAEREVAVTALEATAFALGIHEDTGSLTYPTATQRDAEALAWCLRHGARQELLGQFLHTPLNEDEREVLSAVLAELHPHELAGVEVLVGALAWPSYVDGRTSRTKVVELTDTKALVLLVARWTRGCSASPGAAPEVDAAALAGLLGGGGHPEAASAIFGAGLEQAANGCSTGSRAPHGRRARLGDHVEPRPHGRAGRDRRPRARRLPALWAEGIRSRRTGGSGRRRP